MLDSRSLRDRSPMYWEDRTCSTSTRQRELYGRCNLLDEMEMENEQKETRRSGDRWTFKREISSGDLLIAVGMGLGLFLWGNKIETRLSVVEEKQSMQARIDAQQDSQMTMGLSRIETSLNDIQRYLRDHASK